MVPRRRCKFWNEEMWASHAVRFADGRRCPNIGRWIERVISGYIREGADVSVVELWVRVPRKAKGAKQ